MKQVTLINPGSIGNSFGGAYLDPWTNHGFAYAIFKHQGDQYHLTVLDQDKRPYQSRNLSKDKYSEIYWLLIRRGWKVGQI